jgi:hypothetical protein
MRRCQVGLWAVVVAMVVGVTVSRGQNPGPVQGAATTSPPVQTASTKRKHVHRHATATPSGTVEVIPLESAPPSPPPSPTTEAAQKAADQRLLEKQERQSAQAAQITNQQVQQAEKQQESVQKEVRIQDAPGPAQTGVVPAAGPPALPANADQRIQDAPGPAQTLPPPVQPQPASPPDDFGAESHSSL